MKRLILPLIFLLASCGTVWADWQTWQWNFRWAPIITIVNGHQVYSLIGTFQSAHIGLGNSKVSLVEEKSVTHSISRTHVKLSFANKHEEK